MFEGKNSKDIEINQDWFLYSNRKEPPYNPLNTMIVTNDHWVKNIGDMGSKNWIKEGWLIRSALVPLEKLGEAANELSGLDVRDFETGWINENKFSFGEHLISKKIDVIPWILKWENPISNNLKVELRRDFIIYHALEERNELQYFHPLDDVKVAEIEWKEEEYKKISTKASIHLHYLRDYLAVKGMGLLICVLADRFANIPQELMFKIDELDYELIDEYTWIKINVFSPEDLNEKFYKIRSSLYWNIIIEPYDRPKFERSVWPYYGELPNIDMEEPNFILNVEGERSKLRDHNCPLYLYFKPEVLDRFLKMDNYDVFFHMRNWGAATTPTGKSIDVGINSQGLVNAFVGDLRELRTAEKSYWASHSTLPSGEVCKELFQTRMLCNPPRSIGIIELLENIQTEINDVFKSKFSKNLYNDYHPKDSEKSHLSVGPTTTTDFSQLCYLSKLLYKWIIESMKIVSLRSALGGYTDYDDKWKQIKLLKELLKIHNIESETIKEIINPLNAINNLRIFDAHLVERDLEQVFAIMGKDSLPDNPREAWKICVDSIVDSLNKISEILKK